MAGVSTWGNMPLVSESGTVLETPAEEESGAPLERQTLEPWIGLRRPSAVDPGPTAPSARVSTQGLSAALRASSRYLLRAILAGADATGGDITTAIVVVAVMDADIGHLDSDPDLARRYATYEQAPPNGFRRPTSARAIAARLGLPYETVRRRLEPVIASGRCIRTSRGIYSPTLSRADHLAGAQANHIAIRRLLIDLQQRVPDEAWSPSVFTQTGADPCEPPLRLLNRRSAQFAVDLLSDISAAVGGYDAALVYMALLESTGRCEVVEPPPVIRISPLARSIRQPMESVRRRLAALSAQGLITREHDGYSARHDAAAEAVVGRLAVANLRHLRDFFGGLSRLGVTFAS